MIQTRRILVVDDEASIRDLFAEFLGQCGYAVQRAASAEEALEIMAESPASLLFLDLNLPEMDGITLCRMIRDRWPMAIAVAVTGYASLFTLHNCRKAGFDDYHPKPVSLTMLRHTAEQAFEKLDRWES